MASRRLQEEPGLTSVFDLTVRRLCRKPRPPHRTPLLLVADCLQPGDQPTLAKRMHERSELLEVQLLLCI